MEWKIAVDTVWVLFAACLVFSMNAGFAMLETGLCQAKNAVNVLAKNFIVFGVSAIAFWATGFGLMFGRGSALLGGTEGWFLLGPDNSPAVGAAYSGVYESLNWAGIPLEAKFFFQVTFVATAASIVSGAIAERTKFFSYIVFSFVLAALLYPAAGHWVWGGGWLAELGFRDFAGSTVVHSVGGWAALVGALLVGARAGKYASGGRVRPIPGHNMSLATLGTLILWMGWFGFNAGSTMEADPRLISIIAVNTFMSAAAGCLLATLTSSSLLGKPDLSMTLNGALAGLVAITAPCNAVSVASAVLIGTLAGVFVVLGVLLVERLRVDDPVGAVSVHLFNGIWGTIAVGLFSEEGGLFFGGGFRLTLVQLLGVAAVAALSICGTGATWLLLKSTLGLRVKAVEERVGLDLSEHGMEAYPGLDRASADAPSMEVAAG